MFQIALIGLIATWPNRDSPADVSVSLQQKIMDGILTLEREVETDPRNRNSVSHHEHVIHEDPNHRVCACEIDNELPTSNIIGECVLHRDDWHGDGVGQFPMCKNRVGDPHDHGFDWQWCPVEEDVSDAEGHLVERQMQQGSCCECPDEFLAGPAPVAEEHPENDSRWQSNAPMSYSQHDEHQLAPEDDEDDSNDNSNNSAGGSAGDEARHAFAKLFADIEHREEGENRQGNDRPPRDLGIPTAAQRRWSNVRDHFLPQLKPDAGNSAESDWHTLFDSNTNTHNHQEKPPLPSHDKQVHPETVHSEGGFRWELSFPKQFVPLPLKQDAVHSEPVEVHVDNHLRGGVLAATS